MTKKKFLLSLPALLAFSLFTAPLAHADAGIYAGQIKTPQGGFVGTIAKNGTITDGATQQKIGSVNQQGQVFNPSGSQLGVAVNNSKFSAYQIAKNALPGGDLIPTAGAGGYAGNIQDDSGTVIGRIAPSGVVTDAATSLPIGKVNAKGTVTDISGNVLGTAPAGNRLAVFELTRQKANSGN